MSTKPAKNIDISSLVPISTDIPEKNQGDSAEQNQLSSTKSVERLENDENTSIFDLPAFPNHTKTIECTPKDVLNALEEYANTINPMSVCLSNYGVRVPTFYDVLVAQYDEIRNAYAIARQKKARCYGEAQQKIVEELPDKSEMYVLDKLGHKSLSNAAVQWLKLRSEVYNRLAQVAETGSFVPASKQETINKNISLGFNIQGKLPDDFDITMAGPESILSVLRNKGSNGKK